MATVETNGKKITLYKFFSSLRDFSFLSLNFVNELLYRS